MIAERVERILEKERNSIRHLMVSSCIKRFLPYLPESKHSEFLKSVLMNQLQAWEDQKNVNVLEECRVLGEEHIQTAPAIYTSFHLSSYRMSLKYLVAKGVPITLVASQDVLQEQEEIISRICAQLQNPIEFVDANAPHSLLTMVRTLKRGRSLFIYIDGNTGADGMSNDNRNLFEIGLLNSTLLVRQGVPILSYLAKTPLIPVLCHRSEVLEIQFYPSFFPSEGISREQYTVDALLYLYHILEENLRESPESWEAWLYIYKFVPKVVSEQLKDAEQLCLPSSVRFNAERYKAYEHRTGEVFLFDMTDICAYPIERNIWNVLQKCDEEGVKKLDERELRELLRLKVLI